MENFRGLIETSIEFIYVTQGIERRPKQTIRIERDQSVFSALSVHIEL